MARSVSLFLCVLLLQMLLVSCSTRIQMTCLLPSRTGLTKGSTLSIQHDDNSATARQLSRTLTAALNETGFYTIKPDGEYLLTLNNVREHTRTRNPGEYAVGADERETDLSVGIQLCRKGAAQCFYAAGYRQSSEGDVADFDSLCHDICKDLCPHRVTYQEKINPPAGNPFFEQAVECCRAGHWDTAAPLARKAVLLQPAELETHYQLGLIQRELGYYKASTECFRQAQRADAVQYNSALQTSETQALKQLRLSPTDRSWKHDPLLHSYRKHKEIPLSEFILMGILEAASPVPLPF